MKEVEAESEARGRSGLHERSEWISQRRRGFASRAPDPGLAPADQNPTLAAIAARSAGMAERVGFEPTVQLLTGQPLSKRSCSTTPAPLRRSQRTWHCNLGARGSIGPPRPRGKRLSGKGGSEWSPRRR